MDSLDSIVKNALAEFGSADKASRLAELGVKYLSKKGLVQVWRSNQRERVNKAAYQSAVKAIKDVAEKQKRLIASQKSENLLDVTLPGRTRENGTLHPITICRQQIEDIFISAGYFVADGPEVENEYYNFDALNTPKDHPARAMHDTFYLDESKHSREDEAKELPRLLLRTHTSPVQIRTMLSTAPPLKMICPGKVFRADRPDASHNPIFHQVEGLVVDKNINLGNLKFTILSFLEAFFGMSVQIRLRPSYFPFTEPSAEVDVSCVVCHGKGCSTCSQTGWLEIMGCGMVHPDVLNECKVSSEYNGFAFGFGVDRLCALKYGIKDIRAYLENDLQFLNRFQDLAG